MITIADRPGEFHPRADLSVASRPEGASWGQLLGIGMLGGIGFTMSLFIGMLAFPEPAYAAQVRLGVLAGSLVSAVLGYLLLAASSRNRGA